MSAALPRCSCLLLVLALLLGPRPSAAQETPPTPPTPPTQADLAAMESECLEAKTVEQCKKAIPICEQIESVRQREPDTRNKGLSLARIWAHNVECELLFGRYQSAEIQANRAWRVRHQLLGPEHLETIGSLNDLAVVLGYMGKHGEAEQLYRKVLVVRERVFGLKNFGYCIYPQ